MRTARSASRSRSNPSRSARSSAGRARDSSSTGARGVRRGHQPQPQLGRGVPQLAEGVEHRARAVERGEVHGHRVGARRPQQRQRRRRVAAVDDDADRARLPGRRDQRRHPGAGVRAGHDAHGAEAAGGRQGPGEDGGQRGLVDLDHDAGPGPPREVGDVPAQPLGEALGELRDRAGVGQDPVPAAQLDARRERPRARDLRLHPPRGGPGLPDRLVERVDVAGEQLHRAPVVAAGTRGDAVPAGPHLDGEVDQQRGRAPDDVGADPALGELGDVGEVGQLPDDGAGGLATVGAGQRPDPGGALLGAPRLRHPDAASGPGPASSGPGRTRADSGSLTPQVYQPLWHPGRRHAPRRTHLACPRAGPRRARRRAHRGAPGARPDRRGAPRRGLPLHLLPDPPGPAADSGTRARG